MGYSGGPNQFPVFLKAQADGSVTAEIRKFEDFVSGSMQRVARSATAAGKAADDGFDFSKARRQIDALRSEMDRLAKLSFQRTTDPFGIAGSVAGLKNSPLQRYINEQAAAEASLDAQRRRAHAERISDIQQEFDTAIGAIRARRDATTQAITDMMARERALGSLMQQQAEANRQLVTGRQYIQAPAFDPTFAAQSATAARAHAVALNQLAGAAEQVAAAQAGATATDRAYAATLRQSASAADAEAARLEELAATQTRVATAATGLNTANLSLQASQRGSRFATLQASQQFQDFFIQIGAGTNPMVAFTQQASQLAFVMSAAGGEAGKLARFMSGAGGTVAFAMLALIPVVGMLVGKLLDQNDAVDKAVDKMKKEADQAEANARAHDLWAHSIDGVIDAVRRQNEELDKALATQAGDEQRAVAAAASNLQTLQAALAAAKKDFAALGGDKALADLKKAQLTAGDASAAILPELGKLADAKKKMDDLQASVDQSAEALTKSQLRVAQGQGKAIADLAAKSTQWYQLYTDALSGKNGVLQRNSARLAPSAPQINASVERLSQAMQRAASAGVGFDRTIEKTKQLGIGLDHGTIGVDKYTSSMNALADALERAAKAAEDAKKNAGKTFTQFQMPVQGTITSGFGAREAPKAGASTDHKGIDIAVRSGTPVHAPAVATVEAVGFDPKLGKYVILSHGAGTTTRFGHLSTVSVKAGDMLQQGDVFAQSGATGNVTGPHLHYEVRQGNKPVNPLIGRFQTDEFKTAEEASKAADKAAQKAEREQERLADLAQRASDRIAGISEQWDAQPKLIDAAAAATRKLDETIAQLTKEKPPGYEQLIKDAERAKGVVQEGLLRPMQDITKEADRQQQIDALILAGHEDQAEALRRIFDLKDKVGAVDERDAQTILGIVQAERQRSRALEEHEALIRRAVQSAETLQNAITGVIKAPFDPSSWKKGLSSILGDFRNNFAESISHSLFGNLGKDFEDALRAKSDPLGVAGEHLTDSATDLHGAAVELNNSARAIASAAGPSAGALAATPSAFGGTDSANIQSILGFLGGGTGAAATGDSANIQSILGFLENSDKAAKTSLLNDPTLYYNLLGKTFGTQLDKFLGTGSIFGKLGSHLGTALQGAAIGQTVYSGIGGLLGLSQNKGSNIGSAIGGALGQVAGAAIGKGIGGALGAALGPIGGIVGGLLGGIVGSLFSSKPSGRATIGADKYGNLGITSAWGKDTSRTQASKEAANQVIDMIEAIAQQFNLLVDASKGAVSIGMRGDDYRVDPSGTDQTKGPGVINFGQDSKGAIEEAVKNLIEDGVITGLHEETKKLITEGRNLQAGLEKAIKFENVFKELKHYTDPVGAAIDDLDQQFNELRRIFAEAGASAEEYAQLEQLYAFKRADAIKQATEQMNGALRDLLKDLTYRGDTGLSLQTREATAKQQLAPFQQQISQGQAVDQDAFAEVVRTLLEIERELYGSTPQYFAMLSMLTTLTQQAISTSGGTVVVPGVPTTGTTPTPGVQTLPTGDASGAPLGTVSAPGVSDQVAAANDNYSQTSRLIIAISEQTKALTPLTATEMTAAFREALETAKQVRTIPADQNKGPINPYPGLANGTFGTGF